MKSVVMTAVAPILWGTTYIVTTELLPGYSALVVGTVRALPVGAVFLILGRTMPRGVWWFRSFVLGALNIGIFFACLFYAAYRMPGGLVATIGAIQPLLVVLLSWMLSGTRPRIGTIALSLLGVAGVGLLMTSASSAFDARGMIAAVGSAFSMAGGIVLTKRWGRPVPLRIFTGWQLTAGGLILAPMALLAGGPLPPIAASAVGGFLWIAVLNTALAYVLWFDGIERLPAWRVSTLALLSPVVAVSIGRIVLAQGFTISQWIGIGTIIASVAVVQWSGSLEQPTR